MSSSNSCSKSRLTPEQLQEALQEAITYSSCIMQAKAKEVMETARECLRELLDSLMPDDNIWVVEKLGDWLKKLTQPKLSPA